MAEGLGLEVAVHRVVDHPQDIAVEIAGDAGRVVVGRFEHLDVLDQVHAEQQAVAGVGQERAQTREQPPSLRRVEIADGAPQEEREAPPAGRGHVGEVALEIADHRVNGERRVVPGEPGGGALEGEPVHVQGHVADRPPARGGRVQDEARLLGGARPDLHDVVGKNFPDQSGNNFPQQGRLGAGRIVLGQLGDPLEQQRPRAVVKVLRGQGLLPRGQAPSHVRFQALLLRPLVRMNI